ncbi:MAG: transposase [candidate division Zixibacteria bacterium]|nr:transposase [candidate division Zixibacteria bacterium]MBU1471219.1 transposase [candidate division Zixibacteria bacterium]
MYFLTHVTFDRQPILIDHIDLVHDSIDKHKRDSAFELIAWVVLHDHWHCIINPQENDLADLTKRIKLSFAMRFLKRAGQKSGRTWQNRYWDHIIRNSEDMNNHLDYIHYNPVKHGYVTAPLDWEHSSFHKFVDEGLYRPDWGAKREIGFSGRFGE